MKNNNEDGDKKLEETNDDTTTTNHVNKNTTTILRTLSYIVFVAACVGCLLLKGDGMKGYAKSDEQEASAAVTSELSPLLSTSPNTEATLRNTKRQLEGSFKEIRLTSTTTRTFAENLECGFANPWWCNPYCMTAERRGSTIEVYMARCGNKRSQKWMSTNHGIVNRAYRYNGNGEELCLDMHDPDNHYNAYLYPCHGLDYQRWEKNGGRLKNKHYNYCLDMALADRPGHTKFDLYGHPCHDGYNQQFVDHY